MWNPSEPSYVDGFLLDRRRTWIHIFIAAFQAEESDPEELDTTVLRDQFAPAMFDRFGTDAPSVVARRLIGAPVGWTTRLYPGYAEVDPDDVPF